MFADHSHGTDLSGKIHWAVLGASLPANLSEVQEAELIGVVLQRFLNVVVDGAIGFAPARVSTDIAQNTLSTNVVEGELIHAVA